MRSQDKWLTVLRWVCFVPGAVISAWLAWLIVLYASQQILLLLGSNPDEATNKYARQLVGSGALGAAFIYAGLRIAPGNHRITVILLAGLFLLLAGGSAFVAVARVNLLNLIEVITMLVGAVCMFFVSMRRSKRGKQEEAHQ